MDRGAVRSLALGVAGALLLGLIGYVGGADARGARVRVTAALPTTGQAGTAIRVSGRVTHAPTGAVARLERSPAAGRWVVLAAATIRSGAFTLRWTPASPGFLSIRVAVVRRHALLTATPPRTIAIGAAPVACTPPPAPSLPAGMGAILGGVYNAGGPAPGIYACQGQANVVSLTDAGDATIATQQVPASGSYAFVVAPGTYGLSAGFCRGSATVSTGRVTHADTVCAVP
jgi:hypothetical protein